MNKTTATTIFSVIAVALAVVALVFIVKMGSKENDQNASNNGNGAGNPTLLCYVWNTEAGDHADVRLELSGAGGQQVAGAFNFVPAEKDSKTGTFTGTAGAMDPMTSSRTADVIWNVSGEGMTNREQLLIQFGEGSAAAGFGEMRQDADGVWRYVNPSRLSYSPTLSQTDCNDPAMRGTVPAGKLPAGSAANGDVSKLTANTWVWIATNRTVGSDVTPKKPGAFTIQFGSDGRVSGKTDCNGFGGTYRTQGSALSFGSFMSTLMYCEGSQESAYTSFLATVKSYEIDASGTLVLHLTNGDTMAFRKQ